MSLAIPAVELVGMTRTGSGGIQYFEGYKFSECVLSNISNIPDTVGHQISVHNQLGFGELRRDPDPYKISSSRIPSNMPLSTDSRRLWKRYLCNVQQRMTFL